MRATRDTGIVQTFKTSSTVEETDNFSCLTQEINYYYLYIKNASTIDFTTPVISIVIYLKYSTFLIGYQNVSLTYRLS